MLNVEQITIDLTLPTDEISIVAMQPFLDLQPVEPFKIRENHIPNQLVNIRNTLVLAKNTETNRSAHFTIFPEYSIPGIQGIELIDNEISSVEWSNSSVIVSGIHGLNKDEFQDVCSRYEVEISSENNPLNIPQDKWINCCFIWIKENNGNVRRFIQLKIRPSWPENNVTCNDMFCGSSIYVFKHVYSNDAIGYFTNLICFDWVVSIDGKTVYGELLNLLNSQSNPHTINLDMVFVIQHNDSPNHPEFLNNTSHFLNNPTEYPFVDRKDAIIFHVNTAISDKPSKNGNGAFSACIFSPRAPLDLNGCRPTFCMQPEILRGSTILKQAQCKDVIFREMGQCIHRYKVRVSRFLGAGPAHRSHPISEAEVHAAEDLDDPRLSGKAIPASLKWINDKLDDIDPLARGSLSACILMDKAEIKHRKIIKELRLIEDGQKISKIINWAACTKAGMDLKRNKDRCKNPDLWDHPDTLETHALEHTIHSLTNLGLVYPLLIKESSLHGTLTKDDVLIQVVAIRGENFSDCCIHFDEDIFKSTNFNDPILVIVRDKDNNMAIDDELTKFYNPRKDNELKYLDYQTLVSISRNSDNVTNLKDQIDEYLPEDRRII